MGAMMVMTICLFPPSYLSELLWKLWLFGNTNLLHDSIHLENK